MPPQYYGNFVKRSSNDQKPVDLPGKLTALFKHGLGRKYTAKLEKLDEPTKSQHKKYLNDQFEKATNDYYVRLMQIDPDRFRAYEDFRAMEHTPEIASALDIYAEESLMPNADNELITITTDNQKIKDVLSNLFNDILDVNHNLWTWARNTAKYGDHYILLDVQESHGIVGWLPLPVREIFREEAYDGNINSVKFLWQAYGLNFDQWQIAHFRLLTDQERLPYGTSMLESTRRVWKQLQLAEDAMIVYRITRAPERRVFYVDVGNINPDDVPNFITKIKNSIKRAPQIDHLTGNMSLRYNGMAVDEDYVIPRRGDKSSEIDTLPGASNMDEIADIEYLQQKMFASLKIPKAYLTFDDSINAKSTLAGEDFRFARTVNRFQKALLTELTKIAHIHLFTLGFRDVDQLTSFTLELTNPSVQAEIEKLELMDQQASVFSNLWDETTLSPISLVWGLKNIFNFSDDQIEVILTQQYLEGKMKLEIEEVSGTSPEDLAAAGGDASNPESKFGQGSDRANDSIDTSPRPLEKPGGDDKLSAEGMSTAKKLIREMISVGNEVKPKPVEVLEIRNTATALLTNNTLSSDSTAQMIEMYDPSKLKRIKDLDFSTKKTDI